MGGEGVNWALMRGADVLPIRATNPISALLRAGFPVSGAASLNADFRDGGETLGFSRRPYAGSAAKAVIKVAR
jgi:hypothetical protein